MVNNGASVPPEVPLPRAIDQETNLSTERINSARPARLPERKSWMLS